MLDLDREHALFESELGVSMGSATGAGGEEVRTLTVRLLLGSRLPAGVQTTPKKQASTTALGGFTTTPQRPYVEAPMVKTSDTERPPERSGRERVLHLELCDAEDPYFLYSLDVGESDFQGLRRDLGLLVDFAAFPRHFIELLEKCCEDEQDSESRFFAALETEKDTAYFAVAEANRFKRVSHVALAVRPGDDASVKAYLAGRLRHVSTSKARLELELEAVREEALNSGETVKEISRKLQTTDDAMRRSEADREGERLAESAAWRESTALETAEIRSLHAAELRCERERLQAQVDDAQQKELAARDSEERIGREHRESARRNSELEASLERSMLSSRKAEDSAASERSSRLKAESERDAALSAKHGLEVLLATFKQRAADSETTVARADELRAKADESRLKTTQQVESLGAQVKRREDQLALASAEITKGNGIIEKLSEHSKQQQSKMKLKAQVIKQQERRLEDALRARDDAAHKAQLADAEMQRDRDRRIATERELAATKKKVTDSLDLLDNNQKVIAWLNTELNEHQLGRKTKGTAGAFMNNGQRKPTVVSPPAAAEDTPRRDTPRRHASSSNDHYYSRSSNKSSSPSKQRRSTEDFSATKRQPDAAQAYFEEYGAFSAADFQEESSNSLDLASEVFPNNTISSDRSASTNGPLASLASSASLH